MRGKIKSQSNLAYTVQKTTNHFLYPPILERRQKQVGREFSLFISLQPVTGRHDVCQELQNFLPKDPDAKGLGNIICSNQPY